MFTLWLLQRQLSIKVLEDPCKALIFARVQTSTTNGPIYLVLISICSFIRHTWYNHLYVKISPKFRWTFIPAKETASSWPAISQVNIIVFSCLMLVCPLDTRKVLPLPCLGKLGRFSSAPAQEKKKQQNHSPPNSFHNPRVMKHSGISRIIYKRILSFCSAL